MPGKIDVVEAELLKKAINDSELADAIKIAFYKTNPLKPNLFLFHPDLTNQLVLPQLIIKRTLFSSQAYERTSFGRWFNAPRRLILHQRLMVHQKGSRLRKEPAQLVDDGEAVDVDVSPVMDKAVTQPLD